MNESKEIINGIGQIRFEKRVRYAQIKSPLADFQKVKQEIEYRKDPLIEHWSRVNIIRAERVKQASKPNENYEKNLQEIIENSQKRCFFCPENVLK